MEIIVHFDNMKNNSCDSLGNLDSMSVSFANTANLVFFVAYFNDRYSVYYNLQFFLQDFILKIERTRL